MSRETDAIIFLGLNKSATHEANVLKQQGNKVIFIGKGTPDEIIVSKQKYDLKTRRGITDFVKTLGLGPSGESNLISAIEAGGDDIRDELAKLAEVLVDLDKKGVGATRLIISGHSIGGSFWGDHNGMLEIDNIKRIVASTPLAAGLIEDLHLSACYSGKENDLKTWRTVFPNVQTIWAYSGSAPGSHSGATVHMTRWDKATRNLKDSLDRSIAARTRKGKNVAVWSKRFGYQSQNSSSITDILARIIGAQAMYQSYFDGTKVVSNTQTGELRDYYNDLHALLGHPLVTSAQRIQYEPELETTIRLIYFDKSVKKAFTRHHAGLIADGYREAGMSAPDFAVLSRKNCLKAVDDFTKKVSGLAVKSPNILKLEDELSSGLRDLKPSHIPGNWI
jgi:hypothetical protein